MNRFFNKVHIPELDGCWEWQGCKNDRGYGFFWNENKNIGAHRWSYQWFRKTAIPKDMLIDHICRVRACVRPDHLRIVTKRENALINSLSLAAINSMKTHCTNGHEFTKENTRIKKQGDRECRECNRIRSAKTYKDNGEASKHRRSIFRREHGY